MLESMFRRKTTSILFTGKMMKESSEFDGIMLLTIKM